MWFQAKLLSFYSNLCRTYEISQNPLELKHKKNPIIISASVPNSFWNQIFEEKRLRG